MATSEIVNIPDTDPLAEAGASVLAAAVAWVCSSNDDFQRGAELDRSCKAQLEKVEAVLGPIKADANRVHKKISDLFNKLCDGPKRAREIYKSKMIAWKQEQDRIAEQARIAAEAVARKQEEERRLAVAESLERSGRRQEAMAVIAAPIVTPVVAVSIERPAASGISTSIRWSAECFDLRQLVVAVANGLAPLEFLCANQTALNDAARSMKEGMSYPGVRVNKEEKISNR